MIQPRTYVLPSVAIVVAAIGVCFQVMIAAAAPGSVNAGATAGQHKQTMRQTEKPASPQQTKSNAVKTPQGNNAKR